MVETFKEFYPGNHLILGEAGSGKTRLIWSLLQERKYTEDNSINIVLTDSEKFIWSKPATNPIHILDPFDPDISWISKPQKPGIYYCACDYAPRIVTFLECLATWEMQHDKTAGRIVRVFVDFSTQYWRRPDFAEQLKRLHYIGQNRAENTLEIWAALGSVKKVAADIKNLFQEVNLVLLNPFPSKWSDSIRQVLNLKVETLPDLLKKIDPSQTKGFYYIPKEGNIIFQNKEPIRQINY